MSLFEEDEDKPRFRIAVTLEIEPITDDKVDEEFGKDLMVAAVLAVDERLRAAGITAVVVPVGNQ